MDFIGSIICGFFKKIQTYNIKTILQNAALSHRITKLWPIQTRNYNCKLLLYFIVFSFLIPFENGYSGAGSSIYQGSAAAEVQIQGFRDAATGHAG